MDISAIKVMRNDNGFYLGRSFVDIKNATLPFSRESKYFSNKQEAKEGLKEYFKAEQDYADRHTQGIIM